MSLHCREEPDAVVPSDTREDRSKNRAPEPYLHVVTRIPQQVLRHAHHPGPTCSRPQWSRLERDAFDCLRGVSRHFESPRQKAVSLGQQDLPARGVETVEDYWRHAPPYTRLPRVELHDLLIWQGPQRARRIASAVR